MWNLQWNKPAKTTKDVRRAFILSKTEACWLVKWGGSYDITYTDGSMLKTEIKTLSDLSLKAWVDLANNLKLKQKNLN